MPDITMCLDDSCPSATKCRRNQLSGTKPSDYQSYINFDRKDKKQCGDYYAKNNKQNYLPFDNNDNLD